MLEPVNRPRFQSYMEERMAKLSEVIERKKAKEVDEMTKVPRNHTTMHPHSAGLPPKQTEESRKKIEITGVKDGRLVGKTADGSEVDVNRYLYGADEVVSGYPPTSDLIADLALRVARLEQSKGSDQMAEYRTEKRFAKMGERIVVVNPLSNVVEKGDTFPVEAVDENGNASVDFGTYWISPDEYEVIMQPTTRAEYWAEKRREDTDRLYNVKLYTANANYHVLRLDDETLARLESDLETDVAENFTQYYCHDAEAVVGVRPDAVELYTVKVVSE